MRKWLIIAALAVFGYFNLVYLEYKIMAIAKSTLDFIIEVEGFETKAYKDTKGLWTIGVGHLIKPDEPHLMNAVLTKDQVHELLEKDLNWCDAAVNRSIKVPLTQNQYDALYSLCFNIGAPNFEKSTVVKRLNAKDYKGAADAILMWNKPAVLKKRREKEKALFMANI
jgi:lysozyme